MFSYQVLIWGQFVFPIVVPHSSDLHLVGSVNATKGHFLSFSPMQQWNCGFYQLQLTWFQWPCVEWENKFTGRSVAQRLKWSNRHQRQQLPWDTLDSPGPLCWESLAVDSRRQLGMRQTLQWPSFGQISAQNLPVDFLSRLSFGFRLQQCNIASVVLQQHPHPDVHVRRPIVLMIAEFQFRFSWVACVPQNLWFAFVPYNRCRERSRALRAESSLT